jgi:hypothetical protein
LWSNESFKRVNHKHHFPKGSQQLALLYIVEVLCAERKAS